MTPRFLPPREFTGDALSKQHAWTLAESFAYTKWLATAHYENFHVVSFLLPKHLHQDFYNVYSFCRWADDLGDEMGDTAESLRLLAWWRESTQALYAGQTAHPVFTALAGTVERHGIPPGPFLDLIHAFVRDQTVTRHETWASVFDYCRYSANPVGRLVLYLCGYSDAERQRLSDFTCTALQLANFWQDVSVDLEKGRIYIPREALAAHGVDFAAVEAREDSPGFRRAMADSAAVARDLFARGLPLIGMVDRRLAFDLELFTRGGLKILDKVEQLDYGVLRRRPRITKVERALLLGRALLGWGLRRVA